MPEGCCVGQQAVYYDKCSITGSSMVFSGKHGGGNRRGNNGSCLISLLFLYSLERIKSVIIGFCLVNIYFLSCRSANSTANSGIVSISRWDFVP